MKRNARINRKVVLFLLYFVTALFTCLFILMELQHSPEHTWNPVNDQLEEWLQDPEKLDPNRYKVDINQAQVKDFESLPGIGSSKALAIVAYRESLDSGFTTLEELMLVKGIGEKTFENIRSMITVNGQLKHHMKAGCESVQAIKIRTLQSDSEWITAANELVPVVCYQLASAGELIEEEKVLPDYELKLVYSSDDDSHSLYCNQDWNACRWEGIQEGPKFGLNWQLRQEIAFLIDNSD